ncbi:hypothetical protein MMC22_002082 [Lobaria immixta]|nr:hypothetical protein [Lobaria immixta]
MPSVRPLPQEWHDGEKYMHSLLRVPEGENPTSRGLSSYGSYLVHRSPLLALGILDCEGRPWTTILGGESAFMRPLGPSIVGIRTLAAPRFDPVLELLLLDIQGGGADKQANDGRIVSGLPIDLATRNRVKLSGRLVPGRLAFEAHGNDDSVGKIQLMINVESSLGMRLLLSILNGGNLTMKGNCPKYLNKKLIIPDLPKPVMIADSLPLPEEALRLLAKADMFFISSSNHDAAMGTNHRGGPPGFVRVLNNDSSSTSLIFPEYSGNRLYQTLGNLQVYPKAGLVVPDFDTQGVLYLTGTTEIIVGKAAAALLPRSNLVVQINVTAARFVQQGLAFRGLPRELSPYNPSVRFLPSEHASLDVRTAYDATVYAKLLEKDLISPSIARFRFSVSDVKAAGKYNPGQYVALGFEDELGMGYSHMRDDDPKSLNDDYVRTFTVSSSRGNDLPDDQFEITVRNVGVVTDFLFRQQVRAGLEVPLKGFGGSFALPITTGEIVPFVAGGIGITPLLAQAADLKLDLLRLFWVVNVRDINLVIDTFQRHPSLAHFTRIFLSGINESTSKETKEELQKVEHFGAHLVIRRILSSDITVARDLSPTWYLCTGTALRKSLLEWLSRKKVVYEDFNY